MLGIIIFIIWALVLLFIFSALKVSSICSREEEKYEQRFK